MIERPDDFAERRKKLAHLSEEELHRRFWDLAETIVQPLIELARTHTSPSLERSVLLRMGISSQDATAIVQKITGLGLLGKGAGNVIWRLSRRLGVDVKQAGSELAQGRHWEQVSSIFGAK
ncbi:MAG: D-ornithine 4,5-aminomutase subunit OraS [Bacillota bacterium]